VCVCACVLCARVCLLSRRTKLWYKQKWQQGKGSEEKKKSLPQNSNDGKAIINAPFQRHRLISAVHPPPLRVPADKGLALVGGVQVVQRGLGP